MSMIDMSIAPIVPCKDSRYFLVIDCLNIPESIYGGTLIIGRECQLSFISFFSTEQGNKLNCYISSISSITKTVV